MLYTFIYYYFSFILVYFLVNLCFHYFCDLGLGSQTPKRTIYMHESNKNKKCLTASNFRILSVVVEVCSPPTAYTSYGKGLKYLLKVRFIILIDHTVAEFLIFGIVLLGLSATLPNVCT